VGQHPAPLPPSCYRPQGAREHGMATLAMALILLMIATVMTLGTSNAVINEQRLSGTDSRSKEVQAAASGALQFSIEWLEDNLDDVIWEDNNSDGMSGAGDTATLLPSIGDSELASDVYSRSVTMTLLTDANPADPAMPVVVRLSATAQAQGDSHISKTVTTEIMIGKTSIFSGISGGSTITSLLAPPVLVESCTTSVTGTPDIYPEPSTGIAIGTTTGSTGCIGGFDLNGGSKQALSPGMSLSEAIFGLAPDYDSDDNIIGASRAEAMLRSLEQREPERVFVVDPGHSNLNGGNWKKDLDDDELKPYILFFTKEVGCPKINGSRGIVWGLVFYEASDCELNGWGSAKIYGSLAVSGDLEKFTANAKIYGQELDFGSGSAGNDDGTRINTGFTNRHVAEIPGAWRDF
jgi:hypothetical protein